MLVLRRRESEKIMIGDEVSITVLGIEGATVKLGIEAPSGVDVHRFEVYRRVKLGLEPLRRGTTRAVEPEDDEFDGGSIS
jgi:carbon storage regulator